MCSSFRERKPRIFDLQVHVAEALTPLRSMRTSTGMGTDIAAIAFCTLLAGLAVFQLALALGAPLGRFAWGGGHERLPRNLRIGSLIAIAIYALLATIMLDRAGLARIFPDPAIASIGAWIAVAYLALGIPMNAISRSKPERFTMTPIVTLLLTLALFIALSPAVTTPTA